MDAVDDQRFHLTLYTGKQPVMQGWWGDRSVADGKFTRWIGEYGTLEHARVTLVDEQEGIVLTTWPDEP